MKLGKVNIKGLASGNSNCTSIGKEIIFAPRLEISNKLINLLIVTICNRIEFNVVKRNYKKWSLNQK
jgi:hypothetical protein